MKCPFCAYNETSVIETRETSDDVTRRRRECLKCKRRFTTYEKLESLTIRVVKKDGNRELFDKEKLRRGLIRACEKRPISSKDIDDLVDEIEKRLRSQGKTEVKSTAIGEMVMARLRKLDKVAYIRFASVYKEFKAADDFKKVLKGI